MEKKTQLVSGIREDETESEESGENTRIRIINFVVVIFFGLGLILCGGYALISNHKTIEHEKLLVELKARSRGHSFDGVPRCIASCMLPPILMKGCSHLDPQCICRNLRSLDDYDDTPKPPPRRIRLVKRTPDEKFEDGTSTESLTEVEATVTEVTDVVNASVLATNTAPVEEGKLDDVSVGLGVDNVDEVNIDSIDIKESNVGDETTENAFAESGNGAEKSEDASTNIDSKEIETTAAELLLEEAVSMSVEIPAVDADGVVIEIDAEKDEVMEDVEKATIEAVLPIIEALEDGEAHPGPVMNDGIGQSNETGEYNENGDMSAEFQDPESGTTDYEETKYGTIANETLAIIDEEREFKMCVEECSLHDQIRAPGFLAAYCWGNGAPFEFPEVMIPMVKRAGLNSDYGTGSFYDYSYTDFESSSASATQSRTIATLPVITRTGTGTATRTGTGVQNTAIGTGTVTGFPTFTITPEPTPTPSGGLSTGAKIGLGVAIPLVLLAAVGAFAFWWFRLRKQKPAGQSAAYYDDSYAGMPELAGGAAVKPTGGAGIPSHMHEIRKPEAVYGLDAYQRPVEAGGVPISPFAISEIDGTRQPERSAYELQNTTSSERIPGASDRNHVSGTSQSRATGFPAPWESNGDQYIPTPIAANMGNPSVTSLHNHEASPPSQHASSATTAFQPSNPSTVAYGSNSNPSEVHPQDSVSQVGSATGNNALGVSDDQEIANMEREMAAIKERKDRLRQVAELEEREEALRRGIEARKNQKSGGSGTGS